MCDIRRTLRHGLSLALVLALPVLPHGLAADEPKAPSPSEKPSADTPRLTMTQPVACAKIDGYQRYEPLADATLSKSDKLLVYFEPLNFTLTQMGQKYQGHLVQDVKVRKRGTKTVIWSKENLADYLPEGKSPYFTIYLHNKISIRNLSPGDYDLDIILHDLVAKTSPARQTLQFTVRASPTVEPGKSDTKDADDEPEIELKPKPAPKRSAPRR